MSTQELAKLSQIHYHVDKHDKPKATRKINKALEGSNYELQKLKRGIAMYKNKTDGSIVLNSKGTDIKNSKDIMSDIRLGLGLQKYDRQFKNRTKQIKNLLKTQPAGTVTLTGHSLGASTVSHAMAKSKSIRDNVKEARVFNTGYTKHFNKSLGEGLSTEDQKVLKDKLIHHHVVGDVISTSLLNRNTIGKVKKSNYDGSLNEKHSLNSFVGREREATKPKLGPVIADA
jgi:hypothetical protein